MRFVCPKTQEDRYYAIGEDPDPGAVVCWAQALEEREAGSNEWCASLHRRGLPGSRVQGDGTGRAVAMAGAGPLLHCSGSHALVRSSRPKGQ